MPNLLASFFLWCLAAALLPLAAADPRLTTSINPGWRFWLGEAPTEAVQASFDDRAGIWCPCPTPSKSLAPI